MLHIGSGKTGTTSIQRFLRLNEERLLAAGVLYPRSPGRQRHTRVSLYATPDESLVTSHDWLRRERPAPDVFRRRFRNRLLREIRTSGSSSVIFSDEGLFASEAEKISGVRELLGRIGGDVRLVVYLRRQDAHLASRYQQVIKQGRVETLRDWCRFGFDNYNYRARLQTWLRGLDPAAVAVRPFERDRMVGGSLYDDFIEATGLDLGDVELEIPPPQNESLGAEGVECLRLLNIHHRDVLGQPPWTIAHGARVRRLAAHGCGPVLTLPRDELDKFMASWEESNRWVAVELMGDSGGRLFHSGPSSAGTTTEQLLEPSRLDHYLELLEVPKEHHSALRRIAEREAQGD